MRIVDKTDDGETRGSSPKEVNFLLTNNIGGFTLMSHYTKSRFEGVHFKQGDVFKVIDSFSFPNHVTKIVNKMSTVERHRAGVIENFFMPLGMNSLFYSLNEQTEFDLLLDCRKAYDTREWGRFYDVSKEKHCLIIEFNKKNDDREEFKDEYKIYLAVYSKGLDFMPVQEWIKHDYSYDKKRNSRPYERYVYNAVRLRCKDAGFGFSIDKKEAIKLAKTTYNNIDSLMKEKENHVRNVIHRRHLPEGEKKIAYMCALNAVDSLTVNGKSVRGKTVRGLVRGKIVNGRTVRGKIVNGRTVRGDTGIFAGLPWFFQFWTRDEAIGIKSLIQNKQYTFAEKLLYKYLTNIDFDGRLSNRVPSTNTGCADGVGWIFKRCEELIDAKKVSKKFKNLVLDRLHYTTSLMLKHHVRNGLVHNNAQETWMDTYVGNDTREGWRIEIQTLFLGMYRLLRKLGHPDKFEIELRAKVREEFFKDGYLWDGKDDPTIRPNVFLAAYLYPELLTLEEWKKCFRKVLPKLWLSWGGLSTIDKKSELFTDTHTGENVKSYHRGDSWFWVNNIAAIMMHQVDKKLFSKYINKIVEASTWELLYMGITGYAGELSSAKELRSEGCSAQLWSNSTYVELINEIM